MCRRPGATHGDPGAAYLIADRGLREIQLGSDLVQSPALGVQIGCIRNVHCGTVTSLWDGSAVIICHELAASCVTGRPVGRAALTPATRWPAEGRAPPNQLVPSR